MGCGRGALGACGTFAQILVFLVNTVLFAGSVLLVTGSVLLLKQDNYIVELIDGNNPNQISYIGICLGSVTAFITFFGCAGSCFQSKKIIRLYLVMLVILFILFLTIITLGAVYKNSLRGNLGNGMKKSIDYIKANPNANATLRERTIWDKMQEEMECCGNTRPTNWDFNPDVKEMPQKDDQQIDKISTTTQESLQQGDTRHKREANASSAVQPDYISQEVLDRLPDSCFSKDDKVLENLYQNGCQDEAKKKLDFYVNLILIASGGVALVLVFSILISCWLLKSVKKALAYNF